MKSPLKQTEKGVAEQVTEWLDLNRFCWLYVPNKGRWDKGQDNKTPGAPDIIVVINGHNVCVELKAPGKYQDPAQKKFQAYIEKAGGGIYVVARSYDDLLFLLELRRRGSCND